MPLWLFWFDFFPLFGSAISKPKNLLSSNNLPTLQQWPSEVQCREMPSSFPDDGVQSVAVSERDAGDWYLQDDALTESSKVVAGGSGVKLILPPLFTVYEPLPRIVPCLRLDAACHQRCLIFVTRSRTVSCCEVDGRLWKACLFAYVVEETTLTSFFSFAVWLKSGTFGSATPKMCDPAFCIGLPLRCGPVRSSRPR